MADLAMNLRGSKRTALMFGHSGSTQTQVIENYTEYLGVQNRVTVQLTSRFVDQAVTADEIIWI